MTDTNTLILDLSGVYQDSGFAAAMAHRATRLELSGIEGTTCYCDPDAEARLHAVVADRTERIHWIDSGDYHYLTKVLTDALVSEPFTLVLFDHHPDDQAPAFGGVLSCGGWVASMQAENALLERVIAVGPDGADPALEVDGKAVWISLDKDVLSTAYARTDWSQGELTLPELETKLAEIFRRSARVLGVDICGEFPEHKGGNPEDQRINRETDLAIQQFLEQYIH